MKEFAPDQSEPHKIEKVDHTYGRQSEVEAAIKQRRWLTQALGLHRPEFDRAVVEDSLSRVEGDAKSDS